MYRMFNAIMRIIYMSRKEKLCQVLAASVWFCLISNLMMPSTAFAYVDPGSGSVIVTTILGLIAAVGYTFRKYFYKLRRILTGKRGDSEKNGDK